MTASISVGKLPWAMAIVELPPERSVHRNSVGGWYSLARLPTDPLGYVAATFDGVHAGSEIRIFSLAGVERAGIESCDADHVLTWGVYGSPDTVIVRIVHVAYKIKEFNLRVSKGSATIPVQQEPDPWYSNP